MNTLPDTNSDLELAIASMEPPLVLPEYDGCGLDDEFELGFFPTVQEQDIIPEAPLSPSWNPGDLSEPEESTEYPDVIGSVPEDDPEDDLEETPVHEAGLPFLPPKIDLCVHSYVLTVTVPNHSDPTVPTLLSIQEPAEPCSPKKRLMSQEPTASSMLTPSLADFSLKKRLISGAPLPANTYIDAITRGTQGAVRQFLRTVKFSDEVCLLHFRLCTRTN